MTVENMSGVILVTCAGKSQIRGVTSAYIVDKQTPDDPDIIINVDASSVEYIRAATQIVVNMDGVQKAKYRIV